MVTGYRRRVPVNWGATDEPIYVPSSVRTWAGDRPLTAIWRNEVGGVTFAVRAGAGRQFVKWSPADGPDLQREIQRLEWAAQYIVVPEVVDHGRDEEGSWFVSTAIAGENAVALRWRNDPRTAVTAIGHGLRFLHDELPVEQCPFTWSAQDRIAKAVARSAAGLQDRTAWHPVHRHLDVQAALELLADPPPVDRPVVCHGDACAPNTLIDESGSCCGHVDLGSLGVADRWADLAIATWSTEWNYGAGWESALLDAYGIDPDRDRMAYYRLLWDLT